jgi:D-glycero-D-manno-heptose 1,7-bisphosphate phosphatase
MARAVFLDRDGVVNELVYHQEQEIIDSPFTVNQLKVISGVPEAINVLHQAGYLVILISNQPGIAKGRMTLDSFEKIRLKMKAELAEAGAYLDGEYYCMHHPEAVVEQFKVICDCRKPKSGLLLRAAREHDVDMPQSWFVGDNLSDVEAGKGAGCQTILIGKMKCELCNLMDDLKVRPDSISVNLPEAVRHILKTRA